MHTRARNPIEWASRQHEELFGTVRSDAKLCEVVDDLCKFVGTCVALLLRAQW